MYEGGVVAGASTTAAGVLVLPNTGGQTWLTVVAITSITIGAVILVSSAARLVAKRMR
jgi:hypothetical protein